MAQGPSLVGVDIGSSSVKVCELKESRNGARKLVRFGFHPLPTRGTHRPGRHGSRALRHQGARHRLRHLLPSYQSHLLDVGQLSALGRRPTGQPLINRRFGLRHQSGLQVSISVGHRHLRATGWPRSVASAGQKREMHPPG
jgi:hypothetical protein